MIDIAKLHFRNLYQFILQATGNAYFLMFLATTAYYIFASLMVKYWSHFTFLSIMRLSFYVSSFCFCRFIFPSLRWLKYLLMFYPRMFWFHYLHLNLYYGVRSKDSSFPTSLIATMCQLHLVNDSSSAFPWRS